MRQGKDLREELCYDPQVAELEARQAWRSEQRFAPPADAPGRRNTFVYACTPFTTGHAHIGHVRSYTIADVCARRARSQGDAVLWAMGFDAFGLPNEIAAIRHGIHPREWVAACKARMVEQFDRLGLSVDWTRCFDTSDPEYYRWTQWVFLRFLERELVYRAEGIERWCDTCKSVLASLQVSEQGRCWRCDSPVQLACVQQWYLRFSPYADELESGLGALQGWDEAIVAFQRAQLGRSSGVELRVRGPQDRALTVFTPYAEAIGHAAFIALSPNHEQIEAFVSRKETAIELDRQRLRGLNRDERAVERMPVIDTGLAACIAGSNRELPVIVTPAVDMRFGGGAVLGIPACDRIDAALAEQLGLSSGGGLDAPLDVETRAACRYRLRDSSISRQRSWGAPVPIVHCSRCGEVPVAERDLPVRLPEDLVPTGEGVPLARHPSFSSCACPRCGGTARRDTDTLDVHFDSIWMLVPFCVPAAARATQMFSHQELRRWLPVRQVVCGIDQAAWWVNDRLFFKALKDSGCFLEVEGREPVRQLLAHEMVLAGNRKMSKSLGNTVDPGELIARYGADALRLTVLKVDPRKALNWTEEAIEENYRFLTELWELAISAASAYGGANLSPQEAAPNRAQHKVRRWSKAMEGKVSRAYERQAYHIVARELKVFFERLRRLYPHGEPLERMSEAQVALLVGALGTLLTLLEPIAPHIAFHLLPRIAPAALRSSSTVQAA